MQNVIYWSLKSRILSGVRVVYIIVSKGPFTDSFIQAYIRYFEGKSGMKARDYCIIKLYHNHILNPIP